MAKDIALDPNRKLPYAETGNATYDAQGFLAPIDLFGEAEAADLRRYFDVLIHAVVNADDPRNSYSINCYHLVCERIYEMALDPRVLDRVEALLGPDFVLWGTHVFAKLPGDGKEVPLHQDAVYWPFTTARTATVWYAIDDVDDDNGAMHFVPGSHRDGPLPHDMLELDGTRVLGRRVSNAAQYDDNHYVNALRAGQASIHSDLLLHGSRANTSERRRAGMTLRFAAADVTVEPGWEHWLGPSVHARGEIPERWPNRRRPNGERPERMAEFFGEFDGIAV
ncbi:MAG TPA: phytanoyl-CoA dioxygenase family protein [Acidimicrobiales bacterium]|nr:phytanoyl-CoA dioxygenase family protein [Acidimicrobiales bacterium]